MLHCSPSNSHVTFISWPQDHLTSISRHVSMRPATRSILKLPRLWRTLENRVGLGSQLGRAIAQAITRWLPTAAARVRARIRSCGICAGQSGTGADFLRVLRFPLLNLIPHHIIRGWYNRPVSGRRTKSTVSPHPKKLIKPLSLLLIQRRFRYRVLGGRTSVN
jgi:hypothetical protein